MTTFAVYLNGNRISKFFEKEHEAYEKLRKMYEGYEKTNAKLTCLGYNSFAHLRQDGTLDLFEISSR